MTVYERMAATSVGARRLARARVRYETLGLLHRALGAAGLTQSELAQRLGIRKSAVNQVLRGDGNLRINTLAEYLHECGYEVTLGLVEAGEPRLATIEGRPVRVILPESAPAPSAELLPPGTVSTGSAGPVEGNRAAMSVPIGDSPGMGGDPLVQFVSEGPGTLARAAWKAHTRVRSGSDVPDDIPDNFTPAMPLILSTGH